MSEDHLTLLEKVILNAPSEYVRSLLPILTEEILRAGIFDGPLFLSKVFVKKGNQGIFDILSSTHYREIFTINRIPGEELTALHIAVSLQSKEFVNILQFCGGLRASWSFKSSQNETPQELAIRLGLDIEDFFNLKDQLG